MVSINDRLEFYKGRLLRNNETFTIDYINPDKFIDYYQFKIKYFRNLNDLKKTINNELLYTKPMYALLNKYNTKNKPFLLSVADIWNPHINNSIDVINLPVFTKNRMSDSNDDASVILRSLNFERHWKLYYFPPPDIPFDMKKDIVYWRGVTTGDINKPANRFQLLDKWFNKHNYIDIGFTQIVQGKGKWIPYMKGRNVWPSTFLKHKYLLSVEGNDKDSGLNWKLNSNSLVLMAKPRCQSWLMESKLVPGFHYILLKDDFSDLNEKVIWCHYHQNECKEIIKNAKKYMKQFSNNTVETMIEKTLITTYFDNLA